MTARTQVEWIRAPAVAGTWYPGVAEVLAATVDSYLSAVRRVDGVPLALIVPHAGYHYSGAVAAHGFKQLDRAQIDTAVVIAADHQLPISRPISVWARGGFQTPLGVLPVDEEIAARLLAHDPNIRFDAPAHDGEHPIEIELPFLARVAPNAKIVPILMGDAGEGSVDLLADALLAVLPDQGAVVIASSDLSHYPEYGEAIRVDRATLAAIELGSPQGLRAAVRRSMSQGVRNLATCACGEGPILVAMKVARARGAVTISLLDYANSGDVEIEHRSQVVGYAAVMFWSYETPRLTQEHEQILLKQARTAVETFVMDEPAPSAPLRMYPSADDGDPELQRLSAVFVTLRVGGILRGCIGQLRADTPLQQAVQEKAVAAASADPRFPALRADELADLRVEISVLSPLQRVGNPSEIEIGRDGLAVFDQGKKGVLLPKVAIERDWNRTDFLENTCLKAGLQRQDWKGEAAVYRFESLEIAEAG
ncbi:MAG: AmmeMemoRadiSam system protein B [Chloroflexota bacterium]